MWKYFYPECGNISTLNVETFLPWMWKYYDVLLWTVRNHLADPQAIQSFIYISWPLTKDALQHPSLNNSILRNLRFLQQQWKVTPCRQSSRIDRPRRRRTALSSETSAYIYHWTRRNISEDLSPRVTYFLINNLLQIWCCTCSVQQINNILYLLQTIAHIFNNNCLLCRNILCYMFRPAEATFREYSDTSFIWLFSLKMVSTGRNM